MQVNCAECGCLVGSITGKLVKGWVILCARCYKKLSVQDGPIPDFLRGLGMKGRK